MELAGKKIGFALTGSHCNLAQVFPVLAAVLEEGSEVIPIVSEAVRNTDTRFGRASEWLERLELQTGKSPLETIADVEPIGPQQLLDVLLICPCTGNSMAKIANGVTDSTVSMAAKAQLRNQRPVVLAVTSNDLLGLNAPNLGRLMAVKHVFFVPFGQDDPHSKPNSITADWDTVVPTLETALEGHQLQPLLRQYQH
jgi:dipicolinate synthase subunit B